MSLEQQIGALVKASENLTGAVNGKIGEIDKKVDQSIQDLNNAFPSKYKEFALRTHFVNAIDGNDNNDGLSREKAVRTINQALHLGSGAISQNIYLSIGKHVISDMAYAGSETVSISGDNQNHYPSGSWSESTSSVIHIDKTAVLNTGIMTRLFGSVYCNNCVFTFEGNSGDTSTDNCVFFGRGNVSLRLPLFMFDSKSRGIMKAASDYNPFSALGAELPQFTGEAAFYVKGSGATCIINLDRSIDRTAGMQQKSGSVIVLS